MKRYPFIGLVGPSGSGKTTLITEAIRHLPEHVAIMRSTTTRPRRGPEDDASYEFIARDEMLTRNEQGRLVNVSEYAGNLYAFDRDILNQTLQQRIGIQALVESAIDPLRDAGYDLRIVRIMPIGDIDQRSDARTTADKHRQALFSYTPDKIIENHFQQGGKEHAVETFLTYLRHLIQQSPHLS